ncbi:MAG: hypothetical protein A4E57_02231 [Syntrophorhabdaceae bacterium PtaU1.Bin034]|nr:MAG: hypothetical protein A4E57_02231 [Syntrophorhabdaceae bacterium PtaU1.Bin034]
MSKLLLIFTSLVFFPLRLLAEEKVDVFPNSWYDRSAIYLNLALFWAAIIILIVLIRLKLREIKRVQAMDAVQEEEKIPMLD